MNNFNKVGNLQQRDLELKKKLAEINNIAVKRLMTKEAPLPIVPLSKDKKQAAAKNTPQAIADLSMRDLAFQVKIDDMTDQALDVQPFKVVRAITQEMIDDYQAAPLVPIEINGVNYKYNPSQKELDLEQPTLPNPLLQHIDVRQLKIDISLEEKTKNEELNTLIGEMDNILAQEIDLKNNYSLIMSQIQNQKNRQKKNKTKNRCINSVFQKGHEEY